MYKRVILGLSMLLISGPMLFAETAPLGLVLAIMGGFLIGLPHLHSGGPERDAEESSTTTDAESETAGSAI